MRIRKSFLYRHRKYFLIINNGKIYNQNWGIFCLKMKGYSSEHIHYTLEYLAFKHGLSKERIRQIIKNTYNEIFQKNMCNYFNLGKKYWITVVVSFRQIFFYRIEQYDKKIKIVLSNILKMEGIKYLLESGLVHKFTNADFKCLIKNLNTFTNKQVPHIGTEEELKIILTRFKDFKINISVEILCEILYAFNIDRFIDGYVFKDNKKRKNAVCD